MMSRIVSYLSERGKIEPAHAIVIPCAGEGERGFI